MNADFHVRIRQALADADQAFAKSGDVMEALDWVAFAAKSGEPIPPNMGRWLHKALSEYRNSDNRLSMDAAMGLDGAGKSNPRVRRRGAAELNDALGRMWFLVGAGATRVQAASLVAAKTGRDWVQLNRSYGKSWFMRRTDRPFEGMSAADVRAWVEGMLRDYPDTEETRQEKAAILGALQ